MRVLAHISYYGTGYIGWQRQSNLDNNLKKYQSIQEVIENVLTSLFQSNKRINVTCCSRTDAGTHALWQYVYFDLPELFVCYSELVNQINQKLPESIRFIQIIPMERSIESTFNRKRLKTEKKKYTYYIQQGNRPDSKVEPYTWFIKKDLNIIKIRQALNLLVGRHNFKAFSQGLPKDKNTIRIIYSFEVIIQKNVDFSLNVKTSGIGQIINEKDNDNNVPYIICIEMIGNGFLRHMVRRIIGTIRWIGEERENVEYVEYILNGIKEAGPSAPAKGLWLSKSWFVS